jgi:hypothetical protein
MAFAIVQTRPGGVPSPVLEYFTNGAAAITKGEALVLASELLVISTGAVKLQYIAKKSGVSGDVIPVEVFEEGAIARVGYTGGVPAVGTAYDTDSTGLLLNTADTTNPKLEVIDVDTTTTTCRCKNVARQLAEV